MTTVINNLASGSSPTMYYDVDITETSRASTTVTYSVQVSAWLSSQTYDYFSAHVYPKVVVGNQTLNFTLGTFPKGAGTKTQTLTATVTNLTASSSSVSWTFSATQELGGTSSTSTGYVSARSGTVACSVYASVPTFSGSVTLKEGGTITRTAYFPEDWSATDTFVVSYP